VLEILLVVVSSDFFVLGHIFFAGQMFCWHFLLVFLIVIPEKFAAFTE
jgi:hypothetical protein